MKKVILVAFCLLYFPAAASHIVGGEFELLYVSGNRYKLSLIYYFDLNNNTFSNPPQSAQPEINEGSIIVHIYRKSDNALMRTVTLNYLSKSRVSYTQPACSRGEILTDKLIYTAEFTMLPSEYNNPSGYYVAWERCCRNYTITNIVSQAPPVGSTNFPNAAGQTFYLEFPPVTKGGKQFINSSPKLFPPLNDYACPGRKYYADFAGTDDDGDSLVYSIVTPLSTHTSEANPLVRPAPYPEVRWNAPFSLTNIMGGTPDLKITRDGFLSVTPTFQGLYVFAVKCEEFRDGTRIGEVRRDFQLLVLDICPQAEPPQILGRKLTEVTFPYDEVMAITFANTVNDPDRCIQVQVSDPDASRAQDNFTERVSIRAIPLNFKKDVSGILPTVTNATLTNGSTYTFDICFDRCPLAESGTFTVGIVAYDDACSLPLSDTLKVTVYVEPPANQKPRFVTTPATETVIEGTPMRTWTVDAVDDDGDIMDMFAVTLPPLVFANVGMNFTVQQPQAGNTLHATFTWDPRCNVYDFTQQTDFNIMFLADDRDECLIRDPDSLEFKLAIDLPDNADPVIGTDLPFAALQNGITRKVFESLEFNVFGSDADNDILVLAAQGEGFTLAQHEMSFPQATANGYVESQYGWIIQCDNVNLYQKDEFKLNFIVTDHHNKCRFEKSDTLTVNIKVLPPDNQGPALTVTNTNPQLTFVNNTMSVEVGQQVEMGLVSTDADTQPTDRVTIDLIAATGNVPPLGYVFAAAEGLGMAQTTFSWKPECPVFENGIYTNDYVFTFLTTDTRCFNVKTDTVEVKLNVKDKDAGLAFLPPNIVTPNGDSYNEFFAMVREDKETMVLESILPADNCVGRFIGIVIYNRWGTQIYHSSNRDFKWYPRHQAAGVYFYTLMYSNRDYKGTITLRD